MRDDVPYILRFGRKYRNALGMLWAGKRRIPAYRYICLDLRPFIKTWVPAFIHLEIVFSPRARQNALIMPKKQGLQIKIYYLSASYLGRVISRPLSLHGCCTSKIRIY
ncbi:hypothetical protein Ac2012v2_007320 [Leucoagaricus gongylophorus]